MKPKNRKLVEAKQSFFDKLRNCVIHEIKTPVRLFNRLPCFILEITQPRPKIFPAKVQLFYDFGEVTLMEIYSANSTT
jgi:hypothetical protein